MPLIWFGIGRRFPWVILGDHGVMLGQIFWTLLSALWLAALFRSDKTRLVPLTKKTAAWAWPLLFALALVLIPALDWASWNQFGKQFNELGYSFPTPLLALDVLSAVIGAVILFLKKGERRVFFLFCLLFSVVHLAAAIFEFPLDPRRSDMLPMIDRAIDLFSSGQMAYTSRFNEFYRIPYPPLMWLVYLPTHLLSIDSRWLCVACRIVLGAAIYQRFRKQPLALLYFGFWFLNPYLLFRNDLYLEPFWLTLYFGLEAALGGKVFKTMVWSAVLAGMLQWGWILVPFLLILGALRLRGLALVLMSLSVILVDLALFAIFYLREGPIFIDGLFQNFKLIGSEVFYTELCLGLSAPFLHWHLTGVLVWIQRLCLLGGGLGALLIWKSSGDAPAHGLTPARQAILRIAFITSILFIFLNPLIENYFYLAPFLLAGFFTGTAEKS